jgi:hypothetical protein
MKKIVLICLLLTFKAVLLIVAFKRVEAQRIPPKLCNWDCGYYVDIFYRGYGHPENQSGTEAFYPALPLLTRSLSFLLPGKSFAWKATFMNLMLFGLVLYLLLTWAKAIGFKYGLLLALLVTFDRFSLWAQVPYTEALFISCVLAFLYLLRVHPRSRFAEIFAVFLGGMSTSVRLVGLACVAAFGLSRLKRFLFRPDQGLLFLLLGAWGVLAFFGYLEFSQGSWDTSLKAMAGWNRKFSLAGLFSSTFYLFKMAYIPTLLVFLGALWWVFWPPQSIKLSLVERLTFFLLIFIPLASSNTTSLTRYLSIVYLGHMSFIFAMQTFLLKRMPERAQIAIWSLFFAFEIFFQEQLLEKFLRTEAFSWAG